MQNKSSMFLQNLVILFCKCIQMNALTGLECTLSNLCYLFTSQLTEMHSVWDIWHCSTHCRNVTLPVGKKFSDSSLGFRAQKLTLGR